MSAAAYRYALHTSRCVIFPLMKLRACKRVLTGEEFRALTSLVPLTPESTELIMKSHMDGEVKWVWIITSLAVLYIVTLMAN